MWAISWLSEEGSFDAIIVDVGGFLGLGAHEVALGLDNVEFMRDQNEKLVCLHQLHAGAARGSSGHMTRQPMPSSATSSASSLSKLTARYLASFEANEAPGVHDTGRFFFIYQPAAQPSLRGSEPPTRNPFSRSMRIICPPPWGMPTGLISWPISSSVERAVGSSPRSASSAPSWFQNSRG